MSNSVKPYTITLDDDPIVHKIIAKITGIPSLPFSKPDRLLARASSYAPMALFVDIHLDLGISGLEFLPTIRRLWPFVPIFTITADREDALVGKCLASGANDFIRKPMTPGELTGRLQARLAEMQAKRAAEEVLLHDITFNTRLGTLKKGDQSLYLAKMEAEILLLLSQNIGMTMSKDALKRRIWGDIVVSENALDKKISLLRKALKTLDASFQLTSKYGVGVTLERAHTPKTHEEPRQPELQVG